MRYCMYAFIRSMICRAVLIERMIAHVETRRQEHNVSCCSPQSAFLGDGASFTPVHLISTLSVFI